jgi:hypothetical protein
MMFRKTSAVHDFLGFIVDKCGESIKAKRLMKEVLLQGI